MSKEQTMRIRIEELPIVFNNETIIKKSPALSLSNLEKRMSLRQMRLLSFAILNVAENRTVSKFRKSDFEELYGIKRINKQELLKDTQVISKIGFVFDESYLPEGVKKNSFDLYNLVSSIHYEDGKGNIEVKFNPDLAPLIAEMGKRFLQIDLSLTKQMKHSDSWILYEHLKLNYGPKVRNLKSLEMSVEEINNLFHFTTATYLNNFGNVKSKVLEVARKEINENTELNLKELKYIKKGRKYTHVIFEWTIDNSEYSPTKKQKEYFVDLLKELKSLDALLIEENDNNSLVKEFESVDFEEVTKGQMDSYIARLKKVIAQINRERFKGIGSINFEDPDVIDEVYEKVLSILSEEFSRSIVDIYGYNEFESALEKAKTKMVKANSTDSVADYVSQIISTIIHKNSLKKIKK